MSDELTSDPDIDPSSEPPTIVSSGSGALASGVDGASSAHASSRAPAAAHPESPASKKPRSKMTLRIPDDEVSRPLVGEGGSPASVAASSAPPQAPPIAASRIINVFTPTTQIQVPVVPTSTAAARPAVVVEEDSWTPYQPTAVEQDIPPPPDSVDIPIDSSPDPELPPPSPPPRKLPPVTAPPRSIHAAQPPIGKPVGDARDDVEPVTPAAKLSSSVPPTPGASLPESYPDIVFEEPPAAAPPQTSTKNASESSPPPHAPTVVDASEAPTPVAATGPALPPARPRAQATMDPEELAVDAESDPGRASEPPEISPEDVVSVEPVLDKGSRSPSAPPPPMRPRAPSNPGIAPSLAPAIPRSAKPSSPRVPTTTVRTMVVPAEHAVSSAPAPQTGAPPIPLPRPPPLVIVPGVSPLAPPPMTDAASTRKRVRPWWEELFNDDFIRTMAKITDGQVSKEVDFIEDSLGLAEGAMVLDLACGTGRHAIELTRRGYQVVGFDLSLAMLAKAADEAQDRQQKLNFVQGDMREMTFDGTFDGVYSWSTSFGFFEEEKNAAVVANVRRALKPGGQLLLDVVNRDFVAQQNPSMVWFEGDGCVCMDDMSIDWITSRMKVKRTMMMDDGRSREIEYSIRIYSLHELGKLLHDNGFGVTQVSGRVATPGIFLGADSPRTLILAEKK